MECVEGKKSPCKMEGMALKKDLSSLFSDPITCAFSVCECARACVCLSFSFSPLLILPYQDAETAMNQAVSPSTVSRAPEPSPAPVPLSSPAPVALTSAMPITATCLLWGVLGFLAPRVPRPSQVVLWSAEAG